MALMIAGCDNSGLKFDDGSDAITMAEDEVFALKSVEAVESDVNAARFGGHMFSGGMMISGPHRFFGMHFPDCAEVTVNGDDFPKEIIIDYGDGCVGRAGMQKTGTVIITMSDTITVPGATYTLTFKDVTIGTREVEKTASITNEGLNDDENWEISISSEMTSNMESEGETVVVKREYSERKVWLNGFGTPEWDDDQFLRTGGGTIVVNDELKFERNITDALYIDRACMFPLSGIIQITRGGESMMIDFGEGECDNRAIVTKGEESEEIELLSGRFRKGFQRGHRHMRNSMGWW